ncbi:PTS transporter subunit EIIC [Spiroplasma endosymbiont of Labia minor]|uniref:PTS transporter subunit EIIC n=1 Tax=Spiroplasma endosymbiont of Labia minor TaxID=3066305 RepID=UPI0030CD70B0
MVSTDNDVKKQAKHQEKQQRAIERAQHRAEKLEAFNNTKFGKGWNRFSNSVFGKLQNLARVIVFPIAILPIAGIFLGIGGGLSAAAESNNWGEGVVQFFNILKTIGNIIFACLGVLFATSVAFGFAKKQGGVAAVSALVCYVVMTATISALFIPSVNSAGDQVLLFDPWKLAGKYGIMSVGENKGMIKTVLGIAPTLDLSVIGGIFVGYLVSLVHNKTYNIKVPRILSFFGGIKFVPIASFLLGIGIGVVLFFIWPAFLLLLYYIGVGLGTWMNVGGIENYGRASGVIAAFLFGMFERLLIPAGLHHVLYTPFWYSSAGGQWLTPEIQGGTSVITGWTVTSGSYTIFFEQMNWVGQGKFTLSADAYNYLLNTSDGQKWLSIWTNSGQLVQDVNGKWTIAFNRYTMEVGTVFSSGRFSFMQYGYPFAAIAILQMARKENRSAAAGIIVSAAATSFLTGITEPMLFSFLFVAPLLWVFHAFMAGISFALAYLLNVTVGQGFAAGFIDYIFFGLIPGYSSGIGIAQGNSIWDMFSGRNGCLWIPIYGLLIMAPAYYFGFLAIIKWKNYQTPGRAAAGEDKALEAVKSSLAKGTKKQSSGILTLITALGGNANISDFDVNDKKELVVNLLNINSVQEASIKTAGYNNYSINKSSVVIRDKDTKKMWDLINKEMISISIKPKNKLKTESKMGTVDGYEISYLQKIIDGLGGLENIKVLDNCATRLRVTVDDGAKIDQLLLKETKAVGVVVKGEGVQVIYGPDVVNIKLALEEYTGIDR